MHAPDPIPSPERALILAAIRARLREVAPHALVPDTLDLPGGLTDLANNLDAIVTIVRHTSADRIEPYLFMFLEDICSNCPHQHPNASCPWRLTSRCLLFEHPRPIIEAIHQTLQYLDTHRPQPPTDN